MKLLFTTEEKDVEKAKRQNLESKNSLTDRHMTVLGWDAMPDHVMSEIAEMGDLNVNFRQLISNIKNIPSYLPPYHVAAPSLPLSMSSYCPLILPLFPLPISLICTLFSPRFPSFVSFPRETRTSDQ